MTLYCSLATCGHGSEEHVIGWTTKELNPHSRVHPKNPCLLQAPTKSVNPHSKSSSYLLPLTCPVNSSTHTSFVTALLSTNISLMLKVK